MSRVRVGDIAGRIHSRGYRGIKIDGRDYKAHRLACLYMTGEWPDGDLDHIPAFHRRLLGFGSYRTAWFMCHRIREAMTPKSIGPIGGQNRVVEADKKKNRAFAKKEPKKHTVLTLVDRDGDSHSFHIANVKAKTLRETIVKVASRKSYLATDALASYETLGRESSGHGSVDHSSDEYVRLGGFIHVNTAECRFSLMKRAVFGTHHSISEAHLPRYLAEMGFQMEHPKDDRRGTCGNCPWGYRG